MTEPDFVAFPEDSAPVEVPAEAPGAEPGPKRELSPREQAELDTLLACAEEAQEDGRDADAAEYLAQTDKFW
jgi:hypothetical protein